MSAAWARAHGVTLTPIEVAEALRDAGIARGLADGIERNYAGEPPSFAAGGEAYAITEAGKRVGLLVVQRDCPRRGEATVVAVAIAPGARGRACGVKALLAAERRLAREGVRRVLARVPRTNGRGLYFMLRAGYVPVAASERPQDEGDATWFGRRR